MPEHDNREFDAGQIQVKSEGWENHPLGRTGEGRP